MLIGIIIRRGAGGCDIKSYVSLGNTLEELDPKRIPAGAFHPNVSPGTKFGITR